MVMYVDVGDQIDQIFQVEYRMEVNSHGVDSNQECYVH
jgi:hypothetical protein